MYKQIRNMVGTIVNVCEGKLSEERFRALLLPSSSSSRRDNPCKPAPPEGLTLEHVFFGDEDDEDDGADNSF